MDILTIKIGGSVITDKTKKFSIKEEVLERLARELADVSKKFVLVHGGGSFGHPLAMKYDIASGFTSEEQIEGFMKTHSAMERLNSTVLDALRTAGVPSFPIQTSACTTVTNDKILNIETQNLEKLLDLDIVPVLYGDCIPDLEKGMTILSGDQLVASLAQNLEASRVILGVDTDGVYNKDPKKNKNAELLSEITPESWEEISSSIDPSSVDDVTGGMMNKVRVFIDLAEKGIESQIVNAKKKGILKRAIRGDMGIGTRIIKG